MNAIQFIKDHGVDKARELLARLHKLGCPDDMQITVINGMWHRTANGFTCPELKRLVEGVDLVEQFGNDLDDAKRLLEFSKSSKTIEISGSVITVERLKQAIADYESIYLEQVK